MAETLPLFPLGTVLLPGASLPLHVFEPRYRQLTVDLVTGRVPGKRFGVVAVRDGWTPDDDGIEGLHEIGCSAGLREVRRLPDGRFDIVTLGEARFRLLDVDTAAAPYLVGRVEWVPDRSGVEAQQVRLLALAALEAHRRYRAMAWKTAVDREDGEEPEQQVTPEVLAHVLASDCLLSLADRQELLEQTCPVERLKLIRRFLVRETGLLGELRAVWMPIAKFAVDHSPN